MIHREYSRLRQGSLSHLLLHVVLAHAAEVGPSWAVDLVQGVARVQSFPDQDVEPHERVAVGCVVASVLTAGAESVRVVVEPEGNVLGDVCLAHGGVGQDLHAVLGLVATVVGVVGVTVGAALESVEGAEVVLVPVVEHGRETVDFAALGEVNQGHGAAASLLHVAVAASGALAGRHLAFDAVALGTGDDVLPLRGWGGCECGGGKRKNKVQNTHLLVRGTKTLGTVVQTRGAVHEVGCAGRNLDDAAGCDASNDLTLFRVIRRVIVAEDGLVRDHFPGARVCAVVPADRELAVVRSPPRGQRVPAGRQLDVPRALVAPLACGHFNAEALRCQANEGLSLGACGESGREKKVVGVVAEIKRCLVPAVSPAVVERNLVQGLACRARRHYGRSRGRSGVGAVIFWCVLQKGSVAVKGRGVDAGETRASALQMRG